MQVSDAVNDVQRPQRAVVRSTEGSKPTTSGSQRSRGGRPKGSKNKPKGILPTDMANAILLQMRDMLPAEHFEYMKGVIRDGKAISTKTELDTLILLLSRNLYPALVMEQVPEVQEDEDEEDADDFFADDQSAESSRIAKKNKKPTIKMPVFRKDVTERLKVLQGLLSLRNQVEKRSDEAVGAEKPILTIATKRLGAGDRLGLLVGVVPGAVAGNADGTGRTADETGTVPDQLSERSVVLPSGEQEPTDRI